MISAGSLLQSDPIITAIDFTEVMQVQYNIGLYSVACIGSRNRNGRSCETIRFALTQETHDSSKNQLGYPNGVVPLALFLHR